MATEPTWLLIFGGRLQRLTSALSNPEPYTDVLSNGLFDLMLLSASAKYPIEECLPRSMGSLSCEGPTYSKIPLTGESPCVMSPFTESPLPAGRSESLHWISDRGSHQQNTDYAANKDLISQGLMHSLR